MRFTWNALYVFLYLYRCAFSVVAQLVVLRLTSIPDTTGYQTTSMSMFFAAARGHSSDISFGMQRDAGLLTKAIAASLNLATGGSAILINVGFQTIAFIGIVAFLRAVDPSARRVLAVLVMFPSFTMWTSITSKEAIVVLLVGILAKHVVDIFYGRDRGPVYYVLVLLPLAGALFLFKPHFLAAILFAFGVAKVGGMTRRPATFALLATATSFGLLYLLRDPIGAYVFARYRGIQSEPGNSNRTEMFLSDKYDMFWRAPEGMFRSFFGPTATEAASGVLHLVSFTESVVLLLVLTLVVAVRLPRAPVFMAILGLFTVFWIVFATYPLGLANPGTAVRYRADYILLVYMGLVPLLSRNAYMTWRQKLHSQRPNRVPRGAADPPAFAPT